MIHEQISMFSSADPLLEEAELAMQAMKFEEAEGLYQKARSLNPWISNIDSMLMIVHSFKNHFDRTSDIPSFLGSVWTDLPKAVERGEIKTQEIGIVEGYLAHFADAYLPKTNTYLDTAERIHQGNLFMKTRKWHEAHKVILSSLYDGYQNRADLWGYYGDVCYTLNRMREASAAYAKAMLTDPHRVDYFRMVHPEIKRQLSSLCEEMERRQAQAILLFKCWSAGCITIQRRHLEDTGNGDSEKIHILLSKEPVDESERLHLFSSCLYYDQSQPKDRIHIGLREKMKALDRERFELYLKILQGRENQTVLF